jgi:DNA polymerase I-like protein with 3'-5' exonuclease and polymerase domains
MKLSELTVRLSPQIPTNIVGFDTETFLIDETGQTPRLVCGTFSMLDTPAQSLFKNLGGQAKFDLTQDLLDQTLLLNASDTVLKFMECLQMDGTIIAIHNAKFDLLVLLKECPRLLPYIIYGLKSGRIVCTSIAQAMMNATLPTLCRKKTTSLLDSVTDYLQPDHLARLTKIKKDGEKAIKESKKGGKSKEASLFGDEPTNIRTGYGALIDIPHSQWKKEEIDYAKEDALLVKGLFYSQMRKTNALHSQKNIHFLEDLCRQTYADFVLGYASTHTGMMIDESFLTIEDQILQQREEELVKQLVEMELMVRAKNGKATRKVDRLVEIFEYVYATLNTPRKDRLLTDTKAIATHEEATESLIFMMEKSDIDFKEILEKLYVLDEYKTVSKLRSTYLENFKKAIDTADHRLRFRFNGYGAGTGRTTSSEPNLQNLPRSGRVRQCLKAKEGHIFGLCDYSNAEMRTLSQIHLDEGRKSLLAERYQQDPHFDPHLFVSASFCGVTYEQALEYYADKSHPLYKDLKEKRNLAKVLNFGLAGGLGSEAFISYAKGYGFKGDKLLKRKDVDKSIKAWKEVYPEMKQYFEARSASIPVKDDLLSKTAKWHEGTFEACYPYPRSGRYRYCDGYTNGCNAPFQGMASDGAKNALILVFEECLFDDTSALFGSRIVNFIHDEIIIEIPVDDIDENHYTIKGKAAVDRLSELMKLGMEIMTPDIQAVCETTLSYRWDKEAHSPIKGDRQQVYVSKF